MARKKLLEKIRHQLTLDIETKKISMNSAKFVTDLVSSTHSFSSFDSKFASLSKDFSPKQKGDAFEWFAKLYFLSYAKMYDVKRYFTRLDGQIPSRLNISLKDVGTDGVIEHSSGEISLIQIKYRRPGYGLKRESVVNMAGESKLHPKANVRSLILFSNVLRPPRLDEEERASLVFILKPELIESKWELLQLCALSGLSSKIPQNLTLDLPPLRSWQKEALDWVLSLPKTGRCQLCVACGAGKSRLAREVITQGRYGQVLILVPNLQLLSQWFEMLSVSNPERDYLLVGSDLDVDKDDERIKPRYHLTTSVDDIAKFYVSSSYSIVISTYQSCNRIMESRIDFDLCVADEAHRCCSDENANFSLPTRVDFPSSQIMFMTATPKSFKRSGAENTRKGMDDEKTFGPRFVYSFRKAIEEGIISDYRVVIGYSCMKDDNSENKVHFEHSTNDSLIEQFEARFLLKSVLKYELKNCLIFSSTHAKSKKLYDETVELARLEGIDVECLLMLPKSRSSDKLEARQRIERGEKLLIFNVRVFDVGTDLPKLESVMLSQGNKTIVQTVQSVSRCLRKREGKVAKILVPCLVEDKDDLESKGGFGGLRSFLAALGSVDDAITEEIIGREEVNKRIIFDLVSRSGSLKTNAGVKELKELKDFEVNALERLGDSVAAGLVKKYLILREFCAEKNRLPGQAEKYKGLGIGSFLCHLLSGDRVKNFRTNYIDELRSISNKINSEIDRRLGLKGKKTKFTSEYRFEILYEYCQVKEKIPASKKEWKNVKIGSMLDDLLGGKKYKKTRDDWIEKLLNISERFGELLTSKILRTGTIKPPPEDNYKVLFEFCKTQNRIPKAREEVPDCKIGVFLTNLLKGDQLVDVREEWLEALKKISPEVETEINKRINGQGTRKGQPSPHEKFEILFEYCRSTGQLPTFTLELPECKLGCYFKSLIDGKLYRDCRKEWIDRLCAISPRMSKELHSRAKNYP